MLIAPLLATRQTPSVGSSVRLDFRRFRLQLLSHIAEAFIVTSMVLFE